MMVMPVARRRKPLPADQIADGGNGLVREQRAGIDLAVSNGRQRRARIDRRKPIEQFCGSLRLRQIGLAHEDGIRQRDLAERHIVLVQRAGAADSVDQGHHATQMDAEPHGAHVEQFMDDRSWIGQSRCFDQDAPERGNNPLSTLPQQVLDRLHQASVQRAADAAALEQDDLLTGSFHELMVEADLAELIDDNGRVLHRGRPQQMPHQRGLAAAEEAGDQRYIDRLGGRHIRHFAFRCP